MSDAHAIRPVVVGYDGSPQSGDALTLGVAFARATGAPLLLACAYGPAGILAEADRERRRAAAEERLALALDALPPGAGLAVERRAVAGPSPAAVLQELAEAERPLALVLGSCHRGPIGRVLAGSVAERLLHGSPCPVVVAPNGLAGGPVELRTLCVAFDRRPESWAALQRAAQVAAAAGARLRIVLVLEPFTALPTSPVLAEEVAIERRRRAELELERAAESVSRRLRPETRLLHGGAARMLAAEAQRDVDLMVVGSRGYGPLRRVLLGSVSTELVRSSACPLMIVPRSVEFQPTAEGLAAQDELVGAS